jgi:uncharacterized RDD family membrane protein YckC
MESPQPQSPPRITGLPPGVEVAPLTARFIAFLIDFLAPVAVMIAVLAIAGTLDPGAGRVLLNLLAVLIGICWALVVSWMYATRAAGPGMRLMKLQLVGLTDGRPIGWARFLLRAAALWVLIGSFIGLIALVVLLPRNPRRQALHDFLVDSVVIAERPLAPPRAGSAASVGQGVLPPQQPAPPSQPVYGPRPSPYRQPEPAAAQPYPPAPVPPNPASTQFPAAPPPPVVTGPAEYPGTATTARPQHEGWVAGLDDGRDLEVAGLILLGRNPQGRPGEDDAELIKIVDETRTVSKTHLAIGVDQSGMFVMDRGSTNGSSVTSAGGVSTPCPPGDVIHVAEGNIVSFGDHWLEIKRTPATQ